ncbi:MAG: membrane dipeptidase [Kofleriaceae bacterium]
MTSSRLYVTAIVASMLAMPAASAQPVQGFAELHSHLMGEHAFGGGWFSGTVEGPIDKAVERCSGNWTGLLPTTLPFHKHATSLFPILGELIGADTGLHLGRRRGYDTRRCKYFLGIKIPGTCPRQHFEGWPSWDGVGHQQMWQGWLQQAHAGGMRVMVASLVESSFLCAHTSLPSRRYGCDEMASVYRQAAAAREFVAHNGSWIGLATSPAEARALVAQGKLALVLAVEVTKLFPDGDFIVQLDNLRAQGVSSIQLVHHADNRFAGAVPIEETVSAANKVETLWGVLMGLAGIPGAGAIIGGLNDVTAINDMTCRDANGNKGHCDGLTYLNERGLTAEGTTLVNAMMDRGMLVDIAHSSRRTIQDVYQLAKQRNNYPLFYSHAHQWDTITTDEVHGKQEPKHKHEKYIRADEIHMITETGGMIGLRTGPENTYQYHGATSVPNQCQGSTQSFAQSLLYSVDHGLTVGFGSDFNGMIKNMKPRYRSECPSDKYFIDQAGGPNEFQGKGLAHVGLLPQLMTDLQKVGVAAPYLDQLNRSAENFLVMWERAVGNTGCDAAAGQACGSCGGTVQCNGTCSAVTPPSYGQACGSCGGTITCNSTCSIEESTCLTYAGNFTWSPTGTSQLWGPSLLMPGNYLGQPWATITATMDHGGWSFSFTNWACSGTTDGFTCNTGSGQNTTQVTGYHGATGVVRTWEFYINPP